MNRKKLTATTSFVALATAASVFGIGTAQATTEPAFTLEATPVSPADLPRTEDLNMESSEDDFGVLETYEGDGQDPISACQQSGWAKFNPNTIWTRKYSNDRYPQKAAASIASFASHKEAVAAADAMGKGLAGCNKRMTERTPDLTHGTPEYTRTVTLPSGQQARVLTTYAADGETGNVTRVEAGVTVTGTHVELVAVHTPDIQHMHDTTGLTEERLARSVQTLV